MSGQIYGFNQVFDANGDPLPGALLYTYVLGTTTPKSTYNAADLLTPLPNPIVADSAGRFPQIFAAEGEIYDLVLEDENNVTVQSYYDVASLGISSGDINLDFGLDGRFRVVGANGEPNIEFGDPVGDDVGGDGRIGGWNDTQGTALEVDFANTTFTGAISPASFGTVGGISTPVPVCTARGSFAATPTVNIALNQSFNRWQVILTNVVFASSQLEIVMSFDGGATFKSGASDYQYQGMYNVNVATTPTGVPLTTAAFIAVIPFSTATTAGGADLVIDIMSTTTSETRVLDRFGTFSTLAAANSLGEVAGRTNAKAYGKVTNIRLFNSAAGNMDGSYTVMGMP